MVVAVTGAHGQLGQALQSVVSSQRPKDDYIFLSHNQLDISDESEVSRIVGSVRPDVIVNLAAYTKVDLAEDEPDRAFAINAAGAANLARAARSCDACLIHISTDYVFGDSQSRQPWKEDDPTLPLNVYGNSKLQGEKEIEASGCRHIILRTGWLISKYGNNFFNTMARLTAERESLTVVNDQFGTPTSATDLAAAIVGMISRRAILGAEGTYHFSNMGSATWFELASLINQLLGHQCNVKPCSSTEFPTKAVRPKFSLLSKQKFIDSFGFTPQNWENAVEEIAKDYGK